jgi:hypothetical protein
MQVITVTNAIDNNSKETMTENVLWKRRPSSITDDSSVDGMSFSAVFSQRPTSAVNHIRPASRSTVSSAGRPKQSTSKRVGIANPMSPTASFEAADRQHHHRKDSMVSSTDGDSAKKIIDDNPRTSRLVRQVKFSSASLSALVGLNRQALAEMFDSRETGSVYLLGKMVAVVGLPAGIVIVLTGLLLWSAINTQTVSRTAITELNQFLAIDNLVTNLQVFIDHSSRDIATRFCATRVSSKMNVRDRIS